MFPFDEASSIFSNKNYDPTRNTTFYFHGYKEAPTDDGLHLIVDSYLTRKDQNLIVMDWSRLVSGSYLLSAVPNAIAVSAFSLAFKTPR